jgi:hypothetical protein
MVDVCGLKDIGFTGRKWTYEKKVSGGSFCCVRLDRALVSAEWNSRFPLASVSHHAVAASDHGPILLVWSRETQRLRKRRFRYEVMWESHETFSSTIADSWQQDSEASSVYELHHKLQGVANQLGSWEKSSFGHVRRELKSLKEKLERMQLDPHRAGPNQEELNIIEKINELHHREEVMWRQRSRIQWLAAGDQNTRFFSSPARQRKRKNTITQLKKLNGDFTSDEREIGDMTTDFFRNLYTSEGTRNLDAVLDTVLVKVTTDMNTSLMVPFSEKEVKEVLFQMFPTKAGQVQNQQQNRITEHHPGTY